MGVRTAVGTPPQDMQCYDLDGYKMLLKLDVELEGQLHLVELLGNRVEALNTIVITQEQTIQTKSTSIHLMQAENERVFSLWKDENKKRLEAENKPQLGNWLGWAVAGSATLTAVVLGFVVATK